MDTVLSTQFYEIYRMNGTIYGTPLRAVTTYELRLRFDSCFDLRGKTACFFLVTGDDTIRRSEAIEFAAAVAAGKVVRHHIDLSSVQGVRKTK